MINPESRNANIEGVTSTERVDYRVATDDSIFTVYNQGGLDEASEVIGRNPDGSVTRTREYIDHWMTEQFQGDGAVESCITFYKSTGEMYLERGGQMITIDAEGDSYDILPGGDRNFIGSGDDPISLQPMADKAKDMTDELSMSVRLNPLIPLEQYLLKK